MIWEDDRNNWPGDEQQTNQPSGNDFGKPGAGDAPANNKEKFPDSGTDGKFTPRR